MSTIHVDEPRASSTTLFPSPGPGRFQSNPISDGGRFHLDRRAGFWVIAASTAVLTAFSTAPSPLYALYQRQDRLSSVTITVVYGVYAAGIVVSLLLVGHISDWYGRRPVLIPALLTALVASVIFTFSTSLPALVVG